MIVYVNGRGMNAPELKAYISELEAENAELRAKVESAEHHKAEYKRLLKAAVEDMKDVVSSDCGCRCCKGEQAASCAYIKCWTWRYAAEALALIGEEGEENG